MSQRTPTLRICRGYAAMQQHIVKMADAGYTFWTSGYCRPHKLQDLVEKFSEKYGIHLTRSQRTYRKKKGLANAHMMAVYESSANCFWILLVTPGIGIVHNEEKLRDSKKAGEHIVVNDVHLQRLTRPRMHGGGEHWTWLLLESKFNELQNQATKDARHAQPETIRLFWKQQFGRTMHSGVRTQLKQILRRAIRIWEKRKLQDEAGNRIPWPAPAPDSLPIKGKFREIYHPEVTSYDLQLGAFVPYAEERMPLPAYIPDDI